MSTDLLSSGLSIDDNDDGWGPSTIPDKFKEIPYYTPFNKGERLGKAADWQQQQYQSKGRGYQKEKESTSTIFNYYYNEDDSSFTIVDNTKVPTKRTYGPRKFQKGFQNLRQHQQRGGQAWGQQGGRQKQPPRKHQNLQSRWSQHSVVTRRWGDQPPRKREPSIAVKDTWTLAAEIPFNTLTKISVDEPQPEDLKMCGSLETFDKSIDRASSRMEKPLEHTNRIFFNVTTSDDPIMKQMIEEKKGTVFATGAILERLMTATRSVIPWDIVIRKEGDVLIFDKRDGSQFDYLTVNETAQDPPEDSRESINSSSALGKEATLINQAFSQQVLHHDQRKDFEEPNPFVSEGEEAASMAYRYRKWDLDEFTVIARTEVDALLADDNYLTIKALNEFDPKIHDWRRTIDSQKGSILATELKNNSSKLAQWTLQAILAGTQNIKLGYVTRSIPKDPTNHVVLGTQVYKPREFAFQINLNTNNAWAILSRIVEICHQHPDGKYVLARDNEKNALNLWAVPDEPLEGESK